MKGHKTWFIILMNVLGAFVNLNDMHLLTWMTWVTTHTTHPLSWKPFPTHSLVESKSDGYPFLKSIFEKTVAPHNWFSMSSNHGIGNSYPIMILLMMRLSIHIHQLLSFFGVSKVGTSHGLKLSWINLFFYFLPQDLSLIWAHSVMRQIQ